MTAEPPPEVPHERQAVHHRNVRTRVRIRSVDAIALIVAWSISTLTGFLLYLAPTGPRSGWVVLLFLTKRGWGDVHFWVSVAAVGVTAVHLAVDRKGLRACSRFLVSAHRGRSPRE